MFCVSLIMCLLTLSNTVSEVEVWGNNGGACVRGMKVCVWEWGMDVYVGAMEVWG